MNWQEDILRIHELVDPEYMTIERATYVGQLWEKLKPRNILEIGTFKGTGACYLGAMASHYGGSVVTVDLPWTATDNKYFQAYTAEKQLELCGIHNVQVVRRADGAEGWLKDHFVQKQPPYDFIYIDGGHTWLQVAAQFAMSMAALRVGGWICFDDLKNKEWPEVDLVWRHVVLPLCLCSYERKTSGFVMKTRPVPCPFKAG